MTTTEQVAPSPSASVTTPWSDSPDVPEEHPTFREILDDVLPVIGVVFVAGPPVVFLAAPWLLLALVLSGPFALLVAFVVVAVIAAALLAGLAAIVAAPFVLVRHLHRRYRAAESEVMSVPVAPVAALHSPRVAA